MSILIIASVAPALFLVSGIALAGREIVSQHRQVGAIAEWRLVTAPVWMAVAGAALLWAIWS